MAMICVCTACGERFPVDLLAILPKPPLCTGCAAASSPRPEGSPGCAEDGPPVELGELTPEGVVLEGRVRF